MFSPSAAQAPSGSLRSSRRRQRPLSNEGSIAQPKAKRQRSALSEHTFVSPDGAPEMEEVKSQKISTLPRRDSLRDAAGPKREIAVRGKKAKSGDRSNKADGAVVLVRTMLVAYWGVANNN
jgi:nuclear pore complex protein Nup133